MDRVLLLIIGIVLLTACGKDAEVVLPVDPDEIYAGGETTVFGTFSSLFEQPAPNLNAEEFALHMDGDIGFEATFVTAPAIVNPGLGPYFNQTSCVACHGRNGRAPFPQGADLGGLLLRISIPGADAVGGPMPVPGYGGQLQQRAVFNIQPEARVHLHLEETSVVLSDGMVVSLRKPLYALSDPALGPLPEDLQISPRIAPPVIGLGLLEVVSADDLVALADPDDRDGDGISGRINMVWDASTAQLTIGRFGWKAAQPNLYQQTAAAFNQDMGVTSPLFPDENCVGLPTCDSLANDPEINDQFLKATAFYTQSLGVPARRNADDPEVILGKQIFQDLQCASCHHPSFTTGIHPAYAFLSDQKIYPYTDLLLHDMGEGLADHRPDFTASGSEWRTPPLWGIGLTEIINGHSNFLHDGRARNLTEAVLWHAGEAQASTDAFIALSTSDREALLAFLKSL